MTEEINEPTRPVATRRDKDGNLRATSCTSPQGFKVRALIHEWPKVVIPIVFVPGIMGSNLRVTEDKTIAWRLPNGIVDGLSALGDYRKLTAADRKAILDPANTEVDPGGDVSVWSDNQGLMVGHGKGKTIKDLAQWRGWGEVHEDSYGGILNELEQQLANILQDGEHPEQYWREYALSPSAEALGAQLAWQPLMKDELAKAAQAAYPVHACGYNWLQSNRDSGEALKSRIKEIIDYYKEQKHDCEKVIVVTHSMGGLVARACAKLAGGEEHILGIVHGAMPAIGAPATYKRMRAGFEDMESIILGRDGAEVTAVLANAPGGLELLPTAEYKSRAKDGQPSWLRASGKEVQTLLGAGDPYDAIYLDNNPRHWWRMIKEELINPVAEGGKGDEASGQQTLETNPRTSDGDFVVFANNLDKARKFHINLKGMYHKKTYAFYAADANRKSWSEVEWRSNDPAGAMSEGELIKDDLNGKLTVGLETGAVRFQIRGPKGPGDGTVPEESGEAPKPHCQQIFKHEGSAKQHHRYDHQHCYDNNLTKGVTLYSIIKLAVTSPLLECV